MGDIVRIGVHHVGLPPMGRGVEYFARQTAAYCINTRDFPGGAYQIVLAVDGDWALCYGLTTVTYGMADINGSSVHVCCEGDYRMEPMPTAMVDSLEEVCRWVLHEKRTWAEDTGNATRQLQVVGHCLAPNQQTLCPGAQGLVAVREVNRRLAWA